MLGKKESSSICYMLIVFIIASMTFSYTFGFFIDNQIEEPISSNLNNNYNPPFDTNQEYWSNCIDLGRWDEIYGRITDFEVVESGRKILAYIAVEEGFIIVDVTKPSKSKVIGEFSDGNSTTCIAVNEKYVYITGEDSGLRVFDTTNPSEPELLLQDITMDDFTIMIVDNDFMYAASHFDDQIFILDISNPEKTEIIAQYETRELNYFNNMILKDSKLYLIQYYGCEIVSLFYPTYPQFVAYFYLNGYTLGAAVIEDLFICYHYYNGVSFYDISNSSEPIMVNHFIDRTFSVNEIMIQNELAFLLCSKGIVVIDFSDINNLTRVLDFYYPIDAYIGIMKNDRLYISESGANLQILYFDDENLEIYLVGCFYCGSDINSIYAHDDLAILINNVGFVLIDISNPLKPKTKGAYCTGLSYYVDVYVEGNYAYFLSLHQNLVDIFDISDPEHPTKLAVIPYELQGAIYRLAFYIENSKAHILITYRNITDYDIETAILVYDCSNLDNITLEKDYYLELFSYGFEVQNDNYFVITGDGLYIFSESDNNLTQMSNYSISEIKDTSITSNNIFIITVYQDLTILDISNLTNPTFVNDFDAEANGIDCQEAYDIFYENNHIYINYGDDGVLIININNLEIAGAVGLYHPVKKFNPTSGLAFEYYVLSDVYVQKNIAYVTSYQDGLFIMHLKTLPVDFPLSIRNTNLAIILGIIGVTIVISGLIILSIKIR
ncbi:MAG: hypothetical protein HZR80_16265 [Candidatus Heimdallarchaeota archaeon]